MNFFHLVIIVAPIFISSPITIKDDGVLGSCANPELLCPYNRLEHGLQCIIVRPTNYCSCAACG